MFTDQLPDLLDYINTLHGHLCLLGDVNVHFDKPNEPLTKTTVEILDMYNLKQIVDRPTHKRGHVIDWIVVSDDDNIHCVSIVSDALESDHFCVMSQFDVTTVKPAPVYRYVCNLRLIDHSSFVNDLIAEFDGSLLLPLLTTLTSTSPPSVPC